MAWPSAAKKGVGLLALPLPTHDPVIMRGGDSVISNPACPEQVRIRGGCYPGDALRGGQVLISVIFLRELLVPATPPRILFLGSYFHSENWSPLRTVGHN